MLVGPSNLVGGKERNVEGISTAGSECSSVIGWSLHVIARVSIRPKQKRCAQASQKIIFICGKTERFQLQMTASFGSHIGS